MQNEHELLISLAAPDAVARNAAAIALADLRSKPGMERVRSLLRAPSTEGTRGSLLYALHEAGVELSVAELVDVILTQAPEAQEEALAFLEDGLVERPTGPEFIGATERLRQGGAGEALRLLAHIQWQR